MKKCESDITSNESAHSFDPHPFDHKVSSKMFPTEECPCVLIQYLAADVSIVLKKDVQ